jgi:hypothetical protein
VIKLSPENIAYVAVLVWPYLSSFVSTNNYSQCFHYLAGGETYSQYKGDIDYYENFYRSIMDAFDDEGWAGVTLSWWAMYVTVIPFICAFAFTDVVFRQILEQPHSIRRGRRVAIHGGTD